MRRRLVTLLATGALFATAAAGAQDLGDRFKAFVDQVNGDEACDDGNRVDGDACTNGCTRARCGDGIRRNTAVLGHGK